MELGSEFVTAGGFKGYGSYSQPANAWNHQGCHYLYQLMMGLHGVTVIFMSSAQDVTAWEYKTHIKRQHYTAMKCRRFLPKEPRDICSKMKTRSPSLWPDTGLIASLGVNGHKITIANTWQKPRSPNLKESWFHLSPKNCWACQNCNVILAGNGTSLLPLVILCASMW